MSGYYGGRGGGRSGYGGGSGSGAGGEVPLPEHIQETEQIIRSCHAGGIPASKGRAVEGMPPCPDYGAGRVGRQVAVFVNYFFVQLNSVQAHQYEVIIKRKGMEKEDFDLTPEGRRNILTRIGQGNQWRSWAFDGKKTVFSITDLIGESAMFEIQEGRSDYEISLKKTALVNVDSLKQFVETKAGELPMDVLQMLDIALRHGASLQRGAHLKRNNIYFEDDNARAQRMEGGLVAWTGHHQSLRACAGGVMLNVDLACTAFIEQGAVVEFIRKLREGDRSRDERRFWKKVETSLKGVQIRNTQTNMVRKVKSLGPVPGEAMFHFSKEDKTISVQEYYEKYKNTRIRMPDMPVLNTKGKKKPEYIPAEFAEILPGQPYNGKLNDMQTSSMIKTSAMRPRDRVNFTDSKWEAIARDATVQDFGIRIQGGIQTVEARMLPPPFLEYRIPRSMDLKQTRAPGVWDLRNVQFRNGVKVKSWACVSFCDQRSVGRQLEDFLGKLAHNFGTMRVRNPGPPPVVYYDPRQSPEESLRDAIGAATSAFGQKPDVILVCLPRKVKELYRDVKIAGDCELGIPTQCFVATQAGVGKESRGQLQYIANLAMKVNAKLGGMNWKLLKADVGGVCPFIDQKDSYLVLGADVTHPVSHNVGEPSVAALVGSHDVGATSYACEIEVQSGREEVIQNFKTHAKSLILNFHTKTGRLPVCIIYYRDGVSEGQFKKLEEEFMGLREACREIDPEYCPPITFIVVQKKHHTRLFPKDGPRDRSDNVVPGTVVDSMITNIGHFNFYLTSHSGIKGTSRPTHYHVLVDECNFGPDLIELMTYWMTFTYCRCTRAVSVVPPVYYAHLAAFRAKLLMQAGTTDDASIVSGSGPDFKVHPDLADKMFYV